MLTTRPGGGSPGRMYRKRPSLSCPDLSSDDLLVLRNQHGHAQAGTDKKSGGISQCDRVQQFQQRSYTVADPMTASDESRSAKGGKVKRFFNG